MRLPALLTAGTLTAAALSAALAGTATASSPSSETATPSPTNGVTITSNWTGSIAGTTAGGNACPSTIGTDDNHDVALTIPAGFYTAHTLVATFTVTPATTVDAVLRVTRDAANDDVGSSDNGTVGQAESVTVSNPTAGVFHALACSFAPAATTGSWSSRRPASAAAPSPAAVATGSTRPRPTATTPPATPVRTPASPPSG